MKLNLGCGTHPIKGEDWVNVDLNPAFADVVTDVRDLSQFSTDSVQVVFASHLIEHFYHWEVQSILAEWKRVLIPGGNLYVECPNIENCMRMFLTGKYKDRFTMWGLYGDPTHREPLMCHKWGYTPQTLADELKKAGFVDIGEAPVGKVTGRDMRLVGTKPSGK